MTKDSTRRPVTEDVTEVFDDTGPSAVPSVREIAPQTDIPYDTFLKNYKKFCISIRTRSVICKHCKNHTL